MQEKNKVVALRLILFAALLLYGVLLIRHTAFAVRGPDTTGYANAAYSLIHGPITQPITLLHELDLPPEFAPAFLPLTYLWLPGTDKMAPFYPVGFPLHQALFSSVLGWQRGLYLVSPVLAMLSVWLLYLLGLEFGLARKYAVIGAILFAFCPPFVFHALQALSDVTATFWTLATVLAALRAQKNERWNVLAGAAFGIAFLVRPTSALLLLPLVFVIHFNWRSLFFFVLGGLPFAFIFFLYNYNVFGHPLHTGYSVLGSQNDFLFTGFSARFTHYVYWLIVALSPLVLLSWLAIPFLRGMTWQRRAFLWSWFSVFFFFYCFYSWYDQWWYTRFLLPGIPALVLSLLSGSQNLMEWVTEKFPAPSLRPLLTMGVLSLPFIVFGFELNFLARFASYDVTREQSIFALEKDLASDRAACRWAVANSLLPKNAVIIATELSGTLKFYADRATVRWDFATTEQLQEIMRRATAQKRPLYALLKIDELALAQKKIPHEWIKIDAYEQFSLWRIAIQQ